MEDLRLRTTVLDYSLHIESAVNSLLLAHLEIFDKFKTKNFGNKAGISFKSKIDLLYDINILNSEDHKNLELQMNFRNKFLHDLESDSFIKVLANFDSGIKNRFLKFLDQETTSSIVKEEDYEKCYFNLFLSNMKMLKTKFKEREDKLQNYLDYMTSLYDSYISMNNLAGTFARSIMKITADSELENPIVHSILEPIIECCLKFNEKYQTEFEKIESLNSMHELLYKHKMIIP